MKTLLFSAALAIATGSCALAQTAPAPAPSPSAPAPAASDTNARAAVNGAPLENGANSFTEAQAKSRLEDAGITGVTGLTKDDNGVWRGRGTWQGRSVAVGLDFRGNISAQ
jgi:opacity protein-like surface antigen